MKITTARTKYLADTQTLDSLNGDDKGEERTFTGHLQTIIERYRDALARGIILSQ